MKKAAILITILCALIGYTHAQDTRFIFDRDSVQLEPSELPLSKQTQPQLIKADNKQRKDTISNENKSKILPDMPAWTIEPRLGERIANRADTATLNFHQQTLVDGQDVAVGYLGNWGAPAQTKIFFNRQETSQFNFLDAFNYYYKRPEDQIFLDTKKPLSNFSYYSGGGRQGKEERLLSQMSLSFNKRFSFGFDVDYTFSRGYYTSLSNKQINYNIFSSYRTDRYQMHIFAGNNNFTNIENGGLSELPNNYASEDTKNLPVNYQNTRNKLRGRRLYMTHTYSLGYDREDDDVFVPVASAILTTNYTDQKRRFSSSSVDNIDAYYAITPSRTNAGLELDDRMSYYSFKNTFGIRLNEGFKKWVKFGLTAFIEQDMRKYAMPGENFTSRSTQKHSQNSTVIGGLLSKEKGKHLRYNLRADLGILGYNSGESRLSGDIVTRFMIAGKEANIKANAYVKNLKPTFFENNFVSRYNKWKHDFKNIRREYAGAEIHIPLTNTKIGGGVENISNYIYYGTGNAQDSLNTRVNIFQETKNIQVVSFRFDQGLHWRALHWDNQAVFQTSSNDQVLPLPKFSLYSNLYLQFKISKVLDVQLGVDAHFHSKYYAQAYDPSTLQFYNQHSTKVGGFPFSTAYANFHLKRTRIFMMMYNVAKSYGDQNYFMTPDYLVNPTMFKFGLTWNFTD